MNLEKRNTVNALGIWIVGLTLVAYLGLFFRDIIIARFFGINKDLDFLYLALILPGLLTNVVSQSLGATITPLFQKEHQKSPRSEAQAYAAEAMTFILGILIISALLVLLIPSSWYAPFIKFTSLTDIEHFSSYVKFSIGILLLGGVTILGNSILNALGKAKKSSGAQMALSFGTIAFIFCLVPYYRVKGVIFSMILGQLANLILVCFFCYQEGYKLWHLKMPTKDFYKKTLSGYINLTFAALASGILLPAIQLLAGRLDQGSVSTFTLGNKITVFTTHIISLSMNFVMLPYFSNLITNDQKSKGINELSYYLKRGLIVGILFSFFIFAMAPFLIEILFVNSKIPLSDRQSIARVMQLGVLQIPFFMIIFLIQKYATAIQKTSIVLFSSLLTTIIAIIGSLLFLTTFGVKGLIGSIVVGNAIGAFYIALRVFKLGEISKRTLVFIFWSCGIFALLIFIMETLLKKI